MRGITFHQKEKKKVKEEADRKRMIERGSYPGEKELSSEDKEGAGTVAGA